MSVPDKYLKPYNPIDTEDKIYDSWEKSGYFAPENLPEGKDTGRNANSNASNAGVDKDASKPFSMVLPPPNVTGKLHLGHALGLSTSDIMVRYARMSGRKTVWVPGTDHAAIATQSVVEKKIQKEEGKSRHDLGREELLRRVREYANESHDTIVKQVRKMGASVDWTREAFTLDEKRNLAVCTAFKKMYDDGLIYRGYRVVNWDPKGQTTISDDEIEYETRKTKLYTFKYAKDIPISISTTRPETKLGDTAIAVHPEDARYKKYIGQEFRTIFAGEAISLKVIADISVDKDYGTGALGVTPAHSTVDWEMSQKYNLPLKQVINEYAKMTVGSPEILGKKTVEAREAVVAWLKNEGLLEKEEDIEHNISLAQRTGGVIEPLPKLQWFVAVNKEFSHNGQTTTLKKLMMEAVSTGETKIIPDRFEKVYFNWILNLRDWCISRQIWYGHRIPVWYKGDEIYCGMDAPKGDEWKQDEDTLDTWFSSGLWTFSTLGWPDEKEFGANRAFHPTTMLETGSDILFFWVARMILMSKYLLNEVPFKTVYLHGLIRDIKGRKISKSLGNNIDPLDMIAKYGADALRMSLIVGVGPGNDSKIDEQKIKAYKLFANKLWNIVRFVYSSADMSTKVGDIVLENDKKIISDFEVLKKEITGEMDEYKFYLVGEKLYHYVWHELADKILEESKPILSGTDDTARKSRSATLINILRDAVKMLHPFMPFITEEIWSDLSPTNGEKGKRGMLMIDKWPI